jgi:uncharacterized glyoxalase superfamily protein PhnB
MVGQRAVPMISYEDVATWLSVPWVVDGALVTVDDLDAHHARAVTAGAEILRGPERIPIGRLYTASDHEGHRWMFLQPAPDERPADGVIQR